MPPHLFLEMEKMRWTSSSKAEVEAERRSREKDFP